MATKMTEIERRRAAAERLGPDFGSRILSTGYPDADLIHLAAAITDPELRKRALAACAASNFNLARTLIIEAQEQGFAKVVL